MANFKRDNRFNGRGNRNRRDSERPVMYRVTCSACGKECEVPFKPTSDKPVFCNDCFRNRRDAGQRRFDGKEGKFSSSGRRMYEVICDKCGKKCEVPFKPTSDKPVYCSQCFDRGGKDKSSDQASRQFEIINVKLDKILKALTPAVSAELDEKKKTVKKKKVSKPKSPKKTKGKKKK